MRNCVLETSDDVYFGVVNPDTAEIIDPQTDIKVGRIDRRGNVFYYSDYRATEPDSDDENEADEDGSSDDNKTLQDLRNAIDAV